MSEQPSSSPVSRAGPDSRSVVGLASGILSVLAPVWGSFLARGDVGLGMLLGVIAVGLGIGGRKRSRRAGGIGMRLATAAVVTGLVGIVLFIAQFVLFALFP